MTEEELKAVIRSVMADILTPVPRRALVVFTGGLVGFEQAMTELVQLSDQGVRLDFVQTPSAVRVLDQERIRRAPMQEVSHDLVAGHQVLIAPTLTGNIAAKAAHGVADCLASNLFSEFLMSNRAVVVSVSAVSPDDALKQAWFPHMPVGYADMLRANLAALESFGVRLARADALCRTALAAFDRLENDRMAPLVAALGCSPRTARAHLAAAPSAAPDRPVSAQRHPGHSPHVSQTSGAPDGATRQVFLTTGLVSQGIVQRLPEGTHLRIPMHAKVTAMAKDTAAARSIRITREG